jgi:hypothetical protein
MELKFTNYKWSYRNIELLGLFYESRVVDNVDMVCLLPFDVKDCKGITARSTYAMFDDWNTPEAKIARDRAQALIDAIFKAIYGETIDKIWIEKRLVTMITDEQWERRTIN